MLPPGRRSSSSPPGTTGRTTTTSRQYPCNYTSVNLICVAATSENDALADFSNFGAESVDLAAPGTDILSAWPAYTALATETLRDGPGWSVA